MLGGSGRWHLRHCRGANSFRRALGPSATPGGTTSAGKPLIAQPERTMITMTTVLIVVAIVLVGSAIWGWRGTRQG